MLFCFAIRAFTVRRGFSLQITYTCFSIPVRGTTLRKQRKIIWKGNEKAKSCVRERHRSGPHSSEICDFRTVVKKSTFEVRISVDKCVSNLITQNANVSRELKRAVELLKSGKRCTNKRRKKDFPRSEEMFKRNEHIKGKSGKEHYRTDP